MLVGCSTFSFANDHIQALGHVVSKNEIISEPEKIQALIDVGFAGQSYLAPARVYRYVFLLSSVCGKARTKAKPLHDLVKQGGRFEWGPTQKEWFYALKLSFAATTTVLTYPDYIKPSEVHPDAFDSGIETILVQWQYFVERPIAF